MKQLYFKTLDSTNTYLKTYFTDLEHLTWVSTDYQSQGRGRSHKTWFGNHESLMCSVLLKDHLDLKYVSLLPLLAATSLHKVLFNYAPNLLIKWPNDLLIGRRKIAGILLESQLLNQEICAIIIGFGININQISFDQTLDELAISLYQIHLTPYDKTIIYERLIKQFEIDFNHFIKDPSFVSTYCNQYHALKDQEITYLKGNLIHHAKVLSIDLDGQLRIKDEKGIHSLFSGEVTLKK